MTDRKKSKKKSEDIPEEETVGGYGDEASTEDFGFDQDAGTGWSSDEPSGIKGAVGEGIKKLFAAGLSAAFLTEESVRTYLQDVKLPKEVIKLFLEGAAKSKEQLMDRVGNEVIAIIQKIDFVKEASRFVETHKFRISAEVEVLKKDSSEKSGSSFKVRMDHQEDM